MAILKSTEMPEPQTLDYMKYYQITPLFISDLKKVLADVAFVDAKKYFDKIDEYHGIMCIAVLNEFIRDLGRLPYKVVCGLMNVINNNDNFIKYFAPMDVQEVVAKHPECLGAKIDKQQENVQKK